jgi:membrane-bound metal-dependent hydrolase YbcI (DUF457 family)
MRSRTHILIGFLAFVAYSYLIYTVNRSAVVPWIFGLVAVVAGSVMPDILEPAITRRHRGMCHSRGALILMVFLFGVTALTTFVSLFSAHLPALYNASCFFLGYLFHLLADSLTPAGLPP